MDVIVYRGLFFFSVFLTAYGYLSDGAPGAVTGLIIGSFLCFGLVGLLVTKGVTGGIGGVFLWFIGFCSVTVGMFLFERYWIDGGPIPGKEFGPGGGYFADKVMDLFGRWVTLGQPPGNYTYLVVILVVGFILSGLLGGTRK